MKLPRSRRITRRSEFQRVRTRGGTVRGKYLLLGHLRDEGLDEPFKLGLITTRRLGGAVVRNRVRRRLRGIVQRLGGSIAPGHWIVLVARDAAASASSADLEREWTRLLRRAGIARPGAGTSPPPDAEPEPPEEARP